MSEAEKGYEVSGCFSVDSCLNAINGFKPSFIFLRENFRRRKAYPIFDL